MYLPSIITAIDKSLQYYADNYMHMNFDGIFGLRVLEGSYVPTHALSYSRWRCKTSACCNLSEHSYPLNCFDCSVVTSSFVHPAASIYDKSGFYHHYIHRRLEYLLDLMIAIIYIL